MLFIECLSMTNCGAFSDEMFVTGRIYEKYSSNTTYKMIKMKL
jgi:hypothetical protein